MRITKNQLRQIIKEELSGVLSEEDDWGEIDQMFNDPSYFDKPEAPPEAHPEAPAEATDEPAPPPTPPPTTTPTTTTPTTTTTPEQKLAESRRRKVRRTRKN